MSGTLQTLSGPNPTGRPEGAEQPDSGGSPVGPAGRDRLLDIVRGIAIVRVVLWHTWSWAWLSWIPAMPAMFFTSGALLERSITRRGWTATVKQRLRRLMIPYWLYAAACWVVMVADGWRPTLWQGLAWVVPLGDPVGSSNLPGLWVPLWYIRAYLWFVLGSGLIRVMQRRLGSAAIALSAAGVIAVWALSFDGRELPLALGDAVAYLPFVLAGMAYSVSGMGEPAGRARGRVGTGRFAAGRLGGRACLVSLAITSALSSLWVVQRFGPADKVVNRSYLLTMLVGTAGIAAMTAFRGGVTTAVTSRTRLDAAVRVVNSHALTIYLWQGFGLVAAQRLVELRVSNPLLGAALGLVVVTTVIAGAVVLFGWVEDFAAHKSPTPPRLSRLALCAVPIAVALVAVLLPIPGGSKIEAPLSGRAVVARAGLVEESLKSAGDADATDGDPVPGEVSKAAIDVLREWVRTNDDLLSRIGTASIEVALVSPDGQIRQATWNLGTASVAGHGSFSSTVADGELAWWSMTKSVTTAWMMQLVESGTVSLDDKLGKWVPEAPHGAEITLEQLARHTSGIPSSLDGSFLEESPIVGIEKFYRSGRLAFRPGDGFNYSRIGYFLLALALERASSTTWTDAIRAMGSTAGVQVRFDEDQTPFDQVTDPDGHGYRGGLWSSGGLVTSFTDSVKLLQWIFTEGLTAASIRTMTKFSTDPDHWYYGLGLMPGCPCENSDGYLRAERFGLDAATGLYSVDDRTGAVVMLRPDIWWADEEPVTEFYDLSNRLLDSAAR